MSTGGINDGNKGWRLALRHAPGDVPQSDWLQPKGRRVIASEMEHTMLDLFDNTEPSGNAGMKT